MNVLTVEKKLTKMMWNLTARTAAKVTWAKVSTPVKTAEHYLIMQETCGNVNPVITENLKKHLAKIKWWNTVPNAEKSLKILITATSADGRTIRDGSVKITNKLLKIHNLSKMKKKRNPN